MCRRHDGHSRFVVHHRRAQRSIADGPADESDVYVAAAKAGNALVAPAKLQLSLRERFLPRAQDGRGMGRAAPVVAEPDGWDDGADLAHRVVDVSNCIACRDGKSRSGVGEREVMSRAIDQEHTDDALELRQRTRQRRLRDVQVLSGAGDVVLVGYLEEATKMAKLDGHTSEA